MRSFYCQKERILLLEEPKLSQFTSSWCGSKGTKFTARADPLCLLHAVCHLGQVSSLSLRLPSCWMGTSIWTQPFHSVKIPLCERCRNNTNVRNCWCYLFLAPGAGYGRLSVYLCLGHSIICKVLKGKVIAIVQTTELTSTYPGVQAVHLPPTCFTQVMQRRVCWFRDIERPSLWRGFTLKRWVSICDAFRNSFWLLKTKAFKIFIFLSLKMK